MRVAVLAVVLALAGCEDRSKMCAAIGETPIMALQPKDRIYWKENCAPQLRDAAAAEAARETAKNDAFQQRMSFKCWQEWRESQDKHYGLTYLSAVCRSEYDKALQPKPAAAP